MNFGIILVAHLTKVKDHFSSSCLPAFYESDLIIADYLMNLMFVLRVYDVNMLYDHVGVSLGNLNLDLVNC